MKISPLAGKPAEQYILVNIPRLVTAYYTSKPDSSIAAQRISFGTSGHRGSSFNNSFNENHILAITQAICFYRKEIMLIIKLKKIAHKYVCDLIIYISHS